MLPTTRRKPISRTHKKEWSLPRGHRDRGRGRLVRRGVVCGAAIDYTVAVKLKFMRYERDARNGIFCPGMRGGRCVCHPGRALQFIFCTRYAAWFSPAAGMSRAQ